MLPSVIAGSAGCLGLCRRIKPLSAEIARRDGYPDAKPSERDQGAAGQEQAEPKPRANEHAIAKPDIKKIANRHRPGPMNGGHECSGPQVSPCRAPEVVAFNNGQTTPRVLKIDVRAAFYGRELGTVGLRKMECPSAIPPRKWSSWNVVGLSPR